MNKIQYINYLKIKGIEELPKGESIGSIMEKIGEPTTEDMVEVNKMSMDYFIDKNKVIEAEKQVLEDKCKAMEKDVNWLLCLESAGVDNWEGYGIAIDIKNESLQALKK